MKFLFPEVALCNYKSAITSVIWQKRANHKTEVTRKQTTPNLSINKHFSTYVGVRHVRFSENLSAFLFVTSVLRFAVLPYY